MLILFVFNFHEGLSTSSFYGPFNDNIFWDLPKKSTISRLIRNFEIPLYNPSGFFPIYQNGFYNILYPLNLLFLNLFDTPLHAILSSHIITMFHMILIYGGIYFLIRSIGTTPIPSILGASIFTFSTYISVEASWHFYLYPTAWGLFATAAFVNFLYKDARRWLLPFVVFVSLMVWAGPFMLVFFVYIWLALRLCSLTVLNCNFKILAIASRSAQSNSPL